MAISTAVRASMVDAMMDALNRHYEGKLTYLEVETSMTNTTRVKMIVEVEDADSLEIYRRLHSVLEVCINNNVRSE